MNCDELDEFLTWVGQTAADEGDAPEQFDLEENRRRLLAGLQRLRTDPEERARVDALTEGLVDLIDAGPLVPGDVGGPPQFTVVADTSASQLQGVSETHTQAERRLRDRGLYYSIGLELRPWRVTAVLVDEHGHRLAEGRQTLRDMEVVSVVAAVAAIVRSLTAERPREQLSRDQLVLGLQLGGPVDSTTGRVHYFSKSPPSSAHGDNPSAFRWLDVDLGQLLRDTTGHETLIFNDADALAYRENWVGVGRRTQNFAVVVNREGIGGSVWRDGAPFTGPVEIGNFITSCGGARFSDAGHAGALEAVAGITGIVEGVRERLGRDVASLQEAVRLASEPGADPGLLSPFTSAGVAVACAMSYLVNFAAPSHLVLYTPAVLLDGSNAAEVYLQQVRQFSDGVAFTAYRNVELVLQPDLDQYDGALGAAYAALARQGVRPPAELAIEIGIGR